MEKLDELRVCFEEIGIIVDDISESTDLINLIEDSLTFMTFIISIENQYEFEVPDEYLYPGRLSTIKDVLEMVETLHSTL